MRLRNKGAQGAIVRTRCIQPQVLEELQAEKAGLLQCTITGSLNEKLQVAN